LDHCKGLTLSFFPFAVFHGVHSYYTILRIFAESIMALDVVWMKLQGLAFDI
jgi:hypothetical protein